MPMHAEKRALPYSAAQLFDLVAAVDRYPEFLPWCLEARILRREGNVIHARLVIGYRIFREGFTSRVTLHWPHGIDVEYREGPFRYLNNHWRFIDQADGGCVVDFSVDFEFRSPLVRRLIGVLFNEAVRHMVAAFEAEARRLYGGAAEGAKPA